MDVAGLSRVSSRKVRRSRNCTSLDNKFAMTHRCVTSRRPLPAPDRRLPSNAGRTVQPHRTRQLPTLFGRLIVIHRPHYQAVVQLHPSNTQPGKNTNREFQRYFTMVAKKVFVIKEGVGNLRPKRNVGEKNYAMWGGGSATVVTPVEDSNGDIILAELQCVPSVVGNKQVMNVKPVKVAGERKRKLAAEDELLDPEEEEKRRLRRDRNRLAAAKCRKRRLDQIETLQIEVDGWEKRNRKLEEEIANLRAEKEELAFVLAAHRTSCKLQTGLEVGSNEHVFVKMEEADPVSQVMVEVTPAPLETAKPQRPASLSLQPRSIQGVNIDTPSNGILSFDTLMEGRTGLTPITPITLTPLKPSNSLNTPNCGSQQRNIVFNLQSPLFSPNTERHLLMPL